MNKVTASLSDDDYKALLQAVHDGFEYIGEDRKTHKFRPNPRMEAMIRVQCMTGLRIGDLLKLKMENIMKDGDAYRFHLTEEKTGKPKKTALSVAVYQYLCAYKIDNGIKDSELLFPLTARSLQKNLQIVTKHLGIENVSTHSFRKCFANATLDISNDPMVIMMALNHSSLAVTQRYLAARKLDETLLQVYKKFL